MSDQQTSSAVDGVAVVRKHGILVESGAKHRPVFTEEIAGESIRGSWWSHAKSHAIFAATRAVRRSPDVLVCRLVSGKVTYVHARLWPALFRLRRELGLDRLAHLKEVHTESGAHRVSTVPFGKWVPEAVQKKGAGLSRAAALGALPAHIAPLLGINEASRSS
jgi:hypothetical protein